MPESFETDTLTEIILSHLPADPGSLRFSRIRTGKHNASYWVDSSEGRFVLRIAPSDEVGFLFYKKLMMRQEPELHRLIRAETTLPVTFSYEFSKSF